MGLGIAATRASMAFGSWDRTSACAAYLCTLVSASVNAAMSSGGAEKSENCARAKAAELRTLWSGALRSPARIGIARRSPRSPKASAARGGTFGTVDFKNGISVSSACGFLVSPSATTRTSRGHGGFASARALRIGSNADSSGRFLSAPCKATAAVYDGVSPGGRKFSRKMGMLSGLQMVSSVSRACLRSSDGLFSLR